MPNAQTPIARRPEPATCRSPARTCSRPRSVAVSTLLMAWEMEVLGFTWCADVQKMTKVMPSEVLRAWQQWQRSTFVRVRSSVRSPDGFRSTMRPERTPANWRERSPRIDKLGVTGSSPVPPIETSCKSQQSVARVGDERCGVARLGIATVFGRGGDALTRRVEAAIHELFCARFEHRAPAVLFGGHPLPRSTASPSLPSSDEAGTAGKRGSRRPKKSRKTEESAEDE